MVLPKPKQLSADIIYFWSYITFNGVRYQVFLLEEN